MGLADPKTNPPDAGRAPHDPSNGYEAVADAYISLRGSSTVGLATVREWARALPDGAEVLDLGCGNGVPISQLLIDLGLTVYGVDASPTMIDKFRIRFPRAQAECAPAEEASYFGKSFDGVIAWGLMFLLAPVAQTRVIRKVAQALNPDGRFLFTAPRQACEWPDNLTGLTSISLGADAYADIIEKSGLVLDGEADDEGGNHNYFIRKP